MATVAVVHRGLEVRHVVGSLALDVGRNVGGLLGREVREPLLANCRDYLPRRVDRGDRHAGLTREEKDVAVVVPVISPVLVPARLLDEGALGELAGVPGVERSLRGVWVHLDPDEHAAAGPLEGAQHLQLHAMELDRRVRFADQQHAG